ncbi:MAG TPA: hypothetical protein VFG21_07340 [Xanthomonadaceae bacterium]|nr:hypothetical protein [Xanthomonadaceae bacterium]
MRRLAIERNPGLIIALSALVSVPPRVIAIAFGEETVRAFPGSLLLSALPGRARSRLEGFTIRVRFPPAQVRIAGNPARR